MKKIIIQDKSFNFSLKIIKLYKLLQAEKEFVLSNQLLRSATSIGANIEEAIGGISKRDFIAKLSISSKEARETKYWLNIYKYGDLTKIEVDDEIKEIEEILKILTSIIKSSQESLNKNNS